MLQQSKSQWPEFDKFKGFTQLPVMTSKPNKYERFRNHSEMSCVQMLSFLYSGLQKFHRNGKNTTIKLTSKYRLEKGIRKTNKDNGN